MTFSINDNQHNNTVILLNVVMLCDAFDLLFLLNVIMLSAVMLSVVASLPYRNKLERLPLPFTITLV